jgi:hypothetical protein
MGLYSGRIPSGPEPFTPTRSLKPEPLREIHL